MFFENFSLKGYSMYELKEIKEITKKMILLFDSPITMLSEKTGLSRPTVSKFFNGKTVKPSSTELLYELCFDLIEQKESKRRKINLDRLKTNSLEASNTSTMKKQTSMFLEH
ncbi:hypothetical protein [uncultured Algibacter sp.]|uniref:hypothetical protein n=1 Tax=uncultured Algibacter sp. TaxID=298659 RepID=UPI003217E58E